MDRQFVTDAHCNGLRYLIRVLRYNQATTSCLAQYEAEEGTNAGESICSRGRLWTGCCVMSEQLGLQLAMSGLQQPQHTTVT